jgi:hypothetical protein
MRIKNRHAVLVDYITNVNYINRPEHRSIDRQNKAKQVSINATTLHET